MSDWEQTSQRMRAIDPAAHLEGDPAGPTAQRLRARATATRSGAAPRGRSTPRTSVVVALAGTLVIASTVTAVALGVFDPDPVDVAAILDEAETTGLAAVKNEGWRPALRSERILCVYENDALGTASVAHAEDFPLDRAIGEEDLVAVCEGGTDGTRHLDLTAAGTSTVCEGLVPSEEVRDVVASMNPANTDHGGELLDGAVTDNRPGFPVVLGWDASCEDETIETSPLSTQLESWTAASMQALNRVREIEIGLTAASIGTCLSATEARDLASHARAELDGDWAVLGSPSSQQGSASEFCFGIYIDGQGRGLLAVAPLSPTGSSQDDPPRGATETPTD